MDFAGDTVPVFDGLTGEVRAAKIFVAVLGASNYTFAQARFSEALPDWIGAHVDALSFLGGVPKALVSDYVPRHIIDLMCPPALCGRAPNWPTIAGVRRSFRPHNLQSEVSQFSNAAVRR